MASASVGVAVRWIPISATGTIFEFPDRSQLADDCLLLQKSLFDCVGQQGVGAERVTRGWVVDDVARTVYSRTVSRIVLSLGVLSWVLGLLPEAVSD